MFELALKYASQWDKQPKIRNEVLGKLFGSIRFALMDPKFLVEKVESNKYVQPLSITKSIWRDNYIPSISITLSLYIYIFIYIHDIGHSWRYLI